MIFFHFFFISVIVHMIQWNFLKSLLYHLYIDNNKEMKWKIKKQIFLFVEINTVCML